MKKSILLTSLVLFVLSIQAQQTVSGKMESENGETVIGATVVMRHAGKNKQRSATNREHLLLTGLPAGSYNLLITAIGYEPYQAAMMVQDSGIHLSIKLIPSLRDLQAIEVVGRASRKYTSDYSFGATRFAVNNRGIAAGHLFRNKRTDCRSPRFSIVGCCENGQWRCCLPVITTSIPSGA